MKRSLASIARKSLHQAVRSALGLLPRSVRFSLFRSLIDCDPRPDARLELKIADTQDELEACFRILHDAYVASGFMQPDPSGLRITIYHALPTTTTLCAKWDGRVVGTISMIREGVFGFPLQSVFKLGQVRAKAGKVAEISALAIDPKFRKTGGKILFPLMKFMYEYCREYFDTRHIVIAVNPNKIEMYESLLFFERLQAEVVNNYDFANGAPAVGACLDLLHAPEVFRQAYAQQRDRKNLHRYFVETRLPNIQAPQRRFFTTNDPVMTPAMLDHFFNQRTAVFASLSDRQRLLLQSIYDHETYAAVLPQPSVGATAELALRRHQRFSIRCPARLRVRSYNTQLTFELQVTELSLHGFQAECAVPLPEGTQGRVEVELGQHETAFVDATAVRRHEAGGLVCYGFHVPQPDAAWQLCVAALDAGRTHADLHVAACPAVVPSAPPSARPAAPEPPRPQRLAIAVD
ncbi:MAG: GNAT family N-acetyltransferase [Aquabacterium sp.]|nr:GNAT family N-acetyltransferase [Aquabacterium sp.]